MSTTRYDDKASTLYKMLYANYQAIKTNAPSSSNQDISNLISTLTHEDLACFCHYSPAKINLTGFELLIWRANRLKIDFCLSIKSLIQRIFTLEDVHLTTLNFSTDILKTALDNEWLNWEVFRKFLLLPVNKLVTLQFDGAPNIRPNEYYLPTPYGILIRIFRLYPTTLIEDDIAKKHLFSLMMALPPCTEYNLLYYSNAEHLHSDAFSFLSSFHIINQIKIAIKNQTVDILNIESWLYDHRHFFSNAKIKWIFATLTAIENLLPFTLNPLIKTTALEQVSFTHNSCEDYSTVQLELAECFFQAESPTFLNRLKNLDQSFRFALSAWLLDTNNHFALKLISYSALTYLHTDGQSFNRVKKLDSIPPELAWLRDELDKLQVFPVKKRESETNINSPIITHLSSTLATQRQLCIPTHNQLKTLADENLELKSQMIQLKTQMEAIKNQLETLLKTPKLFAQAEKNEAKASPRLFDA